jgi:hypothetical protein
MGWLIAIVRLESSNTFLGRSVAAGMTLDPSTPFSLWMNSVPLFGAVRCSMLRLSLEMLLQILPASEERVAGSALGFELVRVTGYA